MKSCTSPHLPKHSDVIYSTPCRQWGGVELHYLLKHFWITHPELVLNDKNNGIVVFLKNENLLLKTKLNSFPRLFFFFFCPCLIFRGCPCVIATRSGAAGVLRIEDSRSIKRLSPSCCLFLFFFARLNVSAVCLSCPISALHALCHREYSSLWARTKNDILW